MRPSIGTTVLGGGHEKQLLFALCGPCQGSWERRGASETRAVAETRARHSAEGVHSGALLPDAPTAHQHGPRGTERDAPDPTGI